nr:PQQ-binding-like beta-propeller repeat protein [Pedobacter panaciterrae]
MKTTQNHILCALILLFASGTILAQNKTKGKTAIKKTAASATPCMDVLPLFTSPGVPAMAPEEEFAPLINSTEIPPSNLPGKGLAQHPMLYVGENCNRMSLIKDGKVIWTYSTGKGPEYDDVWMLSNGNILFTRMQYVALITPDKKVLWRYDCNNSKGIEHTEVHSCQPIGLDRVMFVVSGLPPKLMIVNIRTGKIEVEQVLPSNQPPTVGDIHPQLRRARVTAQGTYLISFLNMGRVVEYDKDFKEIWSYKSPKPWAAIRLKNGNTLITDEADNSTREVNSKGEIVWEFNCKTDLPAEYQFTSAPQTCTRLANGNTIFASRGQGGKGPQLIEVTRDKKVVWVLWDWKNVGDATALQVLADPGVPEIPGQSEH